MRSAFNTNLFDDIRTGRPFVSPSYIFFLAFVSVASVDNSSTKLDTFIPRVITHSLKRGPQSSMTSRTRERIAPNSRASLSCHLARESSLWIMGPRATPRSSTPPIHLFLLAASLFSRSRRRQFFQKDPDPIFFYIAFFVTYKRKSIKERIMAGGTDATDYYVKTTALDIH